MSKELIDQIMELKRENAILSSKLADDEEK